MNDNLKNIKKSDVVTIVYLIDFLATRDGVTGGTENQLIEKISILDKNRIRPILFCLQEFVSPMKLWESVECEKHILHVYSFKSFAMIFKLLSFAIFLRKNKVDILETVFFDSIFFGTIAGRLGGVKNIISCRRDMGFWYSPHLLKKLSWVNRITSRVLVNCNAVKQHVVQQEMVPAGNIDIIFNGINCHGIVATAACDICSEFDQVSDGDRIVGMVANFNRQVKRVDLFIRALAKVHEHATNVKFLIIGAGGLMDELQSLAQKLGVEDSLVWAGRKENPIPYVKGFTIAVQPSDSEGFSNAILEYMAVGLPVVATDVGGNREIIRNGETGFLVPKGDHEALAAKILELLADETLATAMGREGQRHVMANFAWEKKIKEVEAYYLGMAGIHK